ncbi:glycosyltransferase family 2 protein [Rhizobium viscosum]|uniref:Glycosyltransferase involved in cell wall biosynthesis n=1 Tax=Rhizobium viscosum TaxID=1673 RepID=A0ABR9IZG9_RHIVS|nr:glycosyltransferase family 2 protein [Rhizobium viscosum]MBE1508578.1 glycosyltransferase involved in cell wall biosynthesis [Rhizobium viscosum]
MNKAPVSVIVPTFCDGEALRRALQSVADQTCQPEEVVIVDDAGGDNTCASVLPNFPQLPIRLVTLKRNVGPGGARNVGVSASRFPFLAFLDADDEWHHSKLERQMELMLAPDAPDFSAHLKGFSAKGWPEEFTERTEKITRWGILLKNPASISTVIIKRSAIRHNFPNWYAGEDYAFVAANLLGGGSGIRVCLTLARADKPAFGTSGLSAKLLAMQLGEMRTHQLLRKACLIGWQQQAFLIPWTLAKFTRRLAIAQIQLLTKRFSRA